MSHVVVVSSPPFTSPDHVYGPFATQEEASGKVAEIVLAETRSEWIIGRQAHVYPLEDPEECRP